MIARIHIMLEVPAEEGFQMKEKLVALKETIRVSSLILIGCLDDCEQYGVSVRQ